jgi:hypothetical protein
MDGNVSARAEFVFCSVMPCEVDAEAGNSVELFLKLVHTDCEVGFFHVNKNQSCGEMRP